MAANRRVQIEAQWGMPIGDVLWRLARRGYEQKEVAQILGVSASRIRAWRRASGCDWPWPTPAVRIENCLRQVRRVTTYTWYQGEERTLKEISRMAGLSYETVWLRYRRGVRGDDLGAPRRSYTNPQRVYELGISVEHWENIIIPYAREKGVDAARQMFRLPPRAVKAALRGEWHMLA